MTLMHLLCLESAEIFLNNMVEETKMFNIYSMMYMVIAWIFLMYYEC